LCRLNTTHDDELHRLIEAWPQLPAKVRRLVLNAAGVRSNK
jgi:hypothetical protein